MEYKNCGQPTKIHNTTLYNCDCMELLKETPDKYYDLAICDPPYGIDWKESKIFEKHKAYKNITWDKVPDEKYFNELKRVSKNWIVWGINYYSKYFDKFTVIFWDKKNGESLFSDGELAGTNIGTASRLFSHAYIGKYNPDPIRIHPTQKPVALYKWLLKNYAKVGDKILDTHCGSGSIAIATHYMGYSLTACELDKGYFDSAVERITNQTRQETLL